MNSKSTVSSTHIIRPFIVTTRTSKQRGTHDELVSTIGETEFVLQRCHHQSWRNLIFNL